MKKIKEERLERVRQMFAQKKSEKEMAEVLGVAPSTIYGYIKELGLKNRNSEQLHRDILKLYSQGKTLTEISFQLDVSKRYVSTVVKKNGVNTHRHFAVTEKDLIDENTVFADNKITLQKVMVGNKKYLDITPVFSPR